MSKKKIQVQGLTIRVEQKNDSDYISLTDIAKYRDKKEPFVLINAWL